MSEDTKAESEFADIVSRIKILENVVARIRHSGGLPLDEDEHSRAGSHLADRRLPTTAVAARYGVVPRTIDRWLDRTDLNFPRPETVNGRRYWWLGKLYDWDSGLARKAATALAAGPIQTPVGAGRHSPAIETTNKSRSTNDTG
jgi:hypothetical protein